MADVLLREYVDRLRELIRGGQYSDAFTLGHHILRYFPKHLETYTLLAQASLDSNDLAGATDLYRRVLGADPENIVALVGMALLEESQDHLGEALWYLERAFEIQPANPEVRRELMRVRESFYGEAPARLELTPGGLARLYGRQGQYAHAINEFNKLQKGDGNRYDLKVALAETLYRAGRVDEAGKLAQQVLADAPYSLKLNLIVGTLWSENGVPEADTFLGRAQAVDPENRVARELIGESFARAAPPRLPALDGMGTATAVAPAAEPETGEARESQDVLTDEDVRRAATFFGGLQTEGEPFSEEIAARARAVDAGEPTAETSATEETPDYLRDWEKFQEQPEMAAPPDSEPPGAGSVIEAAPEAGAEPAVSTPTLEPSREREPAFLTPTPEPSREREPAAALAETATFAGAAPPGGADLSRIDRSVQPPPARRLYPAIPKVRPIVRGAADKIPAWLRLGASAPPTPQVEEPSGTPETAQSAEGTAAPGTAGAERKDTDRPAWLIEAEQASTEVLSTQSTGELPEWLRAGELKSAPAEPAATATPTPTPAAASPELPVWLKEPGIDSSPPAPEADAGSAPAADSTIGEVPDWLKAPTPPGDVAPAPAAAPALEDAATEMMAEVAPPDPAAETTIVPVDTPAVPVDSTTVPVDSTAVPVETTVVPVETTVVPVETTALPVETPAEPTTAARTDDRSAVDSQTLLAQARERRERGDLKGALELYERVMHRRPNYLDEVIADLQAATGSSDSPMPAHRLLGEAYAMTGRFKEALEQYRIAMGK